MCFYVYVYLYACMFSYAFLYSFIEMYHSYLFVVIFLPLTILVEVDTDLKLPIPLPPNDVEEKEVRPPCPSEPNEVKPIGEEVHRKSIWPKPYFCMTVSFEFISHRDYILASQHTLMAASTQRQWLMALNTGMKINTWLQHYHLFPYGPTVPNAEHCPKTVCPFL